MECNWDVDGMWMWMWMGCGWFVTSCSSSLDRQVYISLHNVSTIYWRLTIIFLFPTLLLTCTSRSQKLNFYNFTEVGLPSQLAGEYTCHSYPSNVLSQADGSDEFMLVCSKYTSWKGRKSVRSSLMHDPPDRGTLISGLKGIRRLQIFLLHPE